MSIHKISNEYNDIIKDIIEISKISTKQNSVLYSFEVRNIDIKTTVSVIEKNGNTKTLKEEIFPKNEDFFYYLLTPLIKYIIENNKVASNDIIDMNKDNKTTYRILTDNNDLFTIDGLSFEDTSYFQNVVEELKKKKTEEFIQLDKDNAGKVSLIIIIIVISMVGFIIYLI